MRVLDVRGRHPSSSLPHAKRAEYRKGHVPGAVFVDWEHDFVAVDDPIPVQVASGGEFATCAGALGIADGDLVVTYDDYYGIFAARVAWAFRLYGGEARVLDGGWTTWREEGRAESDRPVAPEPARFIARPRPRLRRTLAEVEVARRSGAALVDARPRHLFLGEQGTANTGHIPGARCLPYQELVDGATGLWASPDAVARLARDCRHRPRSTPERADRHVRQRRVGDRRPACARTHRRALRRRVRRLVQRVERRPDAADRVRQRGLNDPRRGGEDDGTTAGKAVRGARRGASVQGRQGQDRARRALGPHGRPRHVRARLALVRARQAARRAPTAARSSTSATWSRAGCGWS